jgi:hypothetical protein
MISRMGLDVLVGLFLLSCLVAAPAKAEDSQSLTRVGEISPDWRFSLRPYFFLSGLTGSVTSGPLTIPLNSRFTELLENVRLGAFLAFIAEKGQWGAYADLQYISLVGKSSGESIAQLELENVIAEGDVTFRPRSAPTLQFLAGLRVYSIDQTLNILEQPVVKANTTVFDLILGARGEWTLGRHWDFESAATSAGSV